MAVEIKVPTVGESINEVTLTRWIKNDGDWVDRDEVIAELESEKATFEINAEKAGILHTKANIDDTLEIGQVVAEIDDKAEKPAQEEDGKKAAAKEEKTDPAKTGTATAAEKPDTSKTAEKNKDVSTGAGSKPIEIKVPAIGESISEVILTKWTKNDGDWVTRDEVIAELESEKASFEINAEQSGIIHTQAKPDETLAIGQVIGVIDVAAEKPEGAGAEKPAAPKDEKKSESEAVETRDAAVAPQTEKPKATPLAAAIIADKNVDVAKARGTGAHGKLTRNDVISILEHPGVSTNVEMFSRNEETKKMSNLRRTISRRLVEAKNETAMLTTFNEVNMAPIMQIRSKYKDAFKKTHEVGLGFMSFFSKACCFGLQEWPAVNARLDGENLVYHDYVDISIAVSSPKGLVVPVIRNAESLNMAEIEKAVVDLASKARESKLTIEEMTGGTFTITNGGIFGSLLSTPILNIPQSAILGMHNIVERPVAEDGKVVIRPMMYVALSYDHRVVDGRESVSFLMRVKQMLENPEQLLFGKDPVKTLLEL